VTSTGLVNTSFHSGKIGVSLPGKFKVPQELTPQSHGVSAKTYFRARMSSPGYSASKREAMERTGVSGLRCNVIDEVDSSPSFMILFRRSPFIRRRIVSGIADIVVLPSLPKAIVLEGLESTLLIRFDRSMYFGVTFCGKVCELLSVLPEADGKPSESFCAA
jgi:hypothetical protein